MDLRQLEEESIHLTKKVENPQQYNEKLPMTALLKNKSYKEVKIIT